MQYEINPNNSNHYKIKFLSQVISSCSCVTVFIFTIKGSQSSSYAFIFHQTSPTPVGHGGEMDRQRKEEDE